ncbi:MAG: type IV pilus twitching motility protein PilT [Coriobacteriales bacterium]
MTLQNLLQQMVDLRASDIFVIAGLPLSYRLSSRHKRGEGAPLTPADTKNLVIELYRLAGRDPQEFADLHNHDEDFSFALPGVGRFRANVFRQRGSYSAVIRAIPFGLPDAEKLHIPEQALNLSRLRKGLVLVTGPSGAGKTTTLACIIDRLNHERSGHIITMEDPIEYIHRHGTCIVTQREVPTDIATYQEGLRSAMREAPDVILLGEMRDRETIETAMTAAEEAQLIFSTLHTMSASSTISRIVDAFPTTQQHQVRIQLSIVLQAVVCQQLVPSIDGGVVPAFEIMLANTATRNLVRESKDYQIDSVIAAGGDADMYTMDQDLLRLVKTGTVDKDTALRYAARPESLAAHFD